MKIGLVRGQDEQYNLVIETLDSAEAIQLGGLLVQLQSFGVVVVQQPNAPAIILGLRRIEQEKTNATESTPNSPETSGCVNPDLHATEAI